VSIFGAKERAKDFLVNMLAGGAALAWDVEIAARKQSFSLRTLDAAKRELGIVSTKDGLTGGWRCAPPARRVHQGVFVNCCPLRTLRRRQLESSYTLRRGHPVRRVDQCTHTPKLHSSALYPVQGANSAQSSTVCGRYGTVSRPISTFTQRPNCANACDC
jgi:hypothetical protein